MILDEWPSLLFRQTWQLAILAIVVGLVTRLWAKDRPHLAHALWIVVLLKCLVPPLWSCPTSIFSWLAGPSSAVAVDSDEVLQRSSIDRAGGWVSFDINADDAAQANRRSATVDVSIANFTKLDGKAILLGLSGPHWIVCVWILGIGLGLSMTAIRMYVFLNRLRQATVIPSMELEDQLSQLAKVMKIRRRVRLKVIDSPIGPAVMGVWRPTILLPKIVVADRPLEALTPLLAHELIHIRRGDLGWAGLHALAASLWWFHPCIRWAGRSLIYEAERSCDEETIASLGCRPAVYARSLLEVLERKHQLQIAPALPGVRPVDITSARLERIMRLGQGSHRRTPLWTWGVILLCAIGTLPGAALIVAQERPSAKSSAMEVDQDLSYSSPTVTAIPSRSERSADEYDVREFIQTFIDRGQDAKAALNNLKAFLQYDDDVSIKLTRTSTDRIDEGWLKVTANADRQAEIEAFIERVREFGLEQILLEVEIVTLPKEMVESWNLTWMSKEIASSESQRSLDKIRDSVTRLQFDPDHAVPIRETPAGEKTLNAPLVTSLEGKGSNRSQLISHVRSIKRTSTQYATIDQPSVATLRDQWRKSSDTERLSSPRMLVHNGLGGCIETVIDRPFNISQPSASTDDRAPEAPILSTVIVSVGTSVKITPLLRTGDLLQLSSTLDHSVVLNDEQPQSKVPDIQLTHVECTLDVPLGNSVMFRMRSASKNQPNQETLFVVSTQVVPSQAELDDALPAKPVDDAPSSKSVPEISSMPDERNFELKERVDSNSYEFKSIVDASVPKGGEILRRGVARVRDSRSRQGDWEVEASADRVFIRGDELGEPWIETAVRYCFESFGLDRALPRPLGARRGPARRAVHEPIPYLQKRNGTISQFLDVERRAATSLG